MRITRILAACLGGLALAAAHAGAPAAAAEPADYIVVLNGTTDPGAFASGLVDRHGGRVGHVYRHALRGFSATLTPRRRGPCGATPGCARSRSTTSCAPRSRPSPPASTGSSRRTTPT
ncbi:hypothetical protein ACFQV2_11090 [Actinokineospora soli]|uniref:Inhibitor I9 domain-containing protein n=1 Tax=Actinokineospora soli TaxID=1048753 RepID=A0ABW2TK06_9PSEU